ncbi:MAG: sel1 repeat family protein [Bacteroidetes bacterium]|nr:sel1 repeat family protein [Bacteroidota bacterium]
MKIFLLYFLFSFTLPAQDSPSVSVVKKPPRNPYLYIIVRESDATARLWEGFSLVRKANAGDAAAQHELGIRYLIGQGFTADSVKAFTLITQSADQQYMLAHYNLGVFYSNGWGTPWNPFNAFNHFRIAAQNGMPEALFALGLNYTDNLVIKQNWDTAYFYVKQAADKKYQPAIEVLDKLAKLAKKSNDEQSEKQTSLNVISQSTQTNFTPVFLDFDEDSTKPANDKELLEDILRELPTQKYVKDSLNISSKEIFESLRKHANLGVPEEFTVIGRFYETGQFVKRDSIKAAAYYMRAVRLESRRAPAMLQRLLNVSGFTERIEQLAKKQNSEAMYLFGCLALTGGTSFSREQGFQSLQRAADAGNVPAMIETGNALLNGQVMEREIPKAIQYLRNAEEKGYFEARVRLATARLLVDVPGMSLDSAISILHWAEKEGSITAQTTLGICFEQGIGEPKKTAEAVRYYRYAAQRGSLTSYNALKRLYDSLRPNTPEFTIDDFH